MHSDWRPVALLIGLMALAFGLLECALHFGGMSLVARLTGVMMGGWFPVPTWATPLGAAMLWGFMEICQRLGWDIGEAEGQKQPDA